MNDDLITLTGHVGTEVKRITTADGARFVSFRFASTPRKKSRTGEWEDQPTNWYTVVGFGALAENVSASVSVGDPLLITGRLEVASWDKGEKSGIDVKIVAQSVGHDLTRGTGTFTRSVSSRPASGEGAGDTGPTEEAPGLDESDRFADAGVSSTPVVPF